MDHKKEAIEEIQADLGIRKHAKIGVVEDEKPIRSASQHLSEELRETEVATNISEEEEEDTDENRKTRIE